MMIGNFDMNTRLPRRVSIIGAARSGCAAARYFIDKKVTIFISDQCSAEMLRQTIERNGLTGVAYEAGSHSEKVLEADLIVLSPGVPSDLPIILQARSRDIPVWSEMELGFRASRAPFFAVTGSTGKSTTVALTGAVLTAAGIEHVVAGNIGLPVIGSTPAVSEKGFVVAEVSSFQLETIEQFHPVAAVILNLMKNHLDRYPSEDAYYNAKKEIIRNMTAADYLIVNALDTRLYSWSMTVRDRVSLIYFGAEIKNTDAFWCEGTILRYRFRGTVGSIGDCSTMVLKGRHNHHNASVAAALGKIAGIEDATIMRGLCSFAGLPHRLEFVGSVNGVDWYNDSKSTTAESIACAVEAFPPGVHLIAGGKDKGCDFSAVNDSITRRVKDIVLIGEASARIERQWDGLVPIYRATTLRQAAVTAFTHAVPGDAVVFSPGCSSFDMFRDFEDRGEQFRSVVASMMGGECNHE